MYKLPEFPDKPQDHCCDYCYNRAKENFDRENVRILVIEVLSKFADMHRENSDPNELACERGTASDKTIICSGDFELAKDVLELFKEYF